MEILKKLLSPMILCILCLVLFGFLILIAGCGSSGSEQQAVTPAQTTNVGAKSVPNVDTTEQQLRDLEVTPSGDSRCFLSPCDCNCYKLSNVPPAARHVSCGVDCAKEYGKTGCFYEMEQCKIRRT